jgi:hypothetical protein
VFAASLADRRKSLIEQKATPYLRGIGLRFLTQQLVAHSLARNVGGRVAAAAAP